MPGYFTNSKNEQTIERLMREKPTPETGTTKGKVTVRRCINCSAYDKKTETCRLPTCPFGQEKQNECETCPYKKDICNVCYREIMRRK